MFRTRLTPVGLRQRWLLPPLPLPLLTGPRQRAWARAEEEEEEDQGHISARSVYVRGGHDPRGDRAEMAAGPRQALEEWIVDCETDSGAGPFVFPTRLTTCGFRSRDGYSQARRGQGAKTLSHRSVTDLSPPAAM